MFHPLAPSRIAAALPDARLIVLLRDPVERAWSHYHNERRLQAEPLSFEDAIRSEPERLVGQAEQMAADPGFQGFAWRHWSYLARGRYAEQLERLYELFPPSQVLVVQSELLRADPTGRWRRCGGSSAWPRPPCATASPSSPTTAMRRWPPPPARASKPTSPSPTGGSTRSPE